MADNAKFVVEFQAEVKKLRAAIAELKKAQKDAQQGAKQNQNLEKRYQRERDKHVKDSRKQDEKSRKEEKKHIQFMSREESKRNKAQLSSMQRQQAAYANLLRKNQQLEKQLSKRASGGGGPGGQGRQGGGFWRGLGVGMAADAAVRGAWGMLVGGATAGYQKFMEYRATMGRNIGLGRGRDINRAVRGARGGQLGYSLTESAGMVAPMARATGQLSPRELQQGGRASGLETGEVADVFGAIRRAGYDFTPQGKKGSAGANEFKKIMSASVASGLEKGRLPEFAQGVMQIVEQQRSMATGTIRVADIAKTLAMWGSSGRPGLQGAAGAGVFQKVTGGIMSPGGGDWGQAFMNQAMGFGKPGGQTGFYEAEKRREQAGRRPEIIMDVMKEFAAQFGGFGKGGGEESALAMREALGVTLAQAEALQDIYKNSQSVDEKQAQIAKIMEEAQPIDKQSLDAMKEIGGGVKRIAELTDRGIGIGAKAAHIIEKVEDVEYKMLQQLIRIAEGVERIVGEISSFFGGGKKSTAATSGALDTAENASEGTRRARTAKQALEAYKSEHKALSAVPQEQRNLEWTQSPEGMLEAARNLATGDITGAAAKRQYDKLDSERRQKQLNAAVRAQRAQQILEKYGDVPLTAELKKYISQGSEDDAGPPPLSTQKAHRKGKSSAALPKPPPVKESADNDVNSTLSVDVNIRRGGWDARDTPEDLSASTPGSGTRVSR